METLFLIFISMFLISSEMTDVWRERNPEGRVFSRRQVVRGVLKQSRIDFSFG